MFSMETLYLYLPLLILALQILTNRILHKIQNLPPSPFPALPFLGHLYLLKKPFHKSLSALSSRYGPVLSLRLGCIPVVLVSSPLAAEECLAKNDIIFANRPNFLNGKYFGYNYTSLPWSSYGEHWRNLRKISSLEVLSSHKLQLLSAIRADEVLSLIRKLFRVSVEDPGQFADMRSACFDLTFNVMTRMITGNRYYGENIENSEEARIFHEITSEAAKVNPKANVLDFLPFMRWFGLRDVVEKMSEIQERRDKFMQNVIDEHRARAGASGEKRTMIGALLDLHEKEPEYYSEETIRNLMLVLLQAGSDTTASTMEWAMAYLLDNPEVLKKAQAEIDQEVGQGRFIAECDLPQLPYLRCIINETLRLQPVTPLLMPHKASQDCIVGGYRVPRGTVLFVNAWDIQHNSRYWDDPEKFMPQRFEAWVGGKEEFKFIPFGSGRRGCPGNNLAIHILGLALGSLLQSFNWETRDGKKMDMSEGIGVPVHRVQPLVAKCCPRPNMLKLLSQISTKSACLH
nr:cytochrome P450 81F2-like isoform X2 [Coffea arabica]